MTNAINRVGALCLLISAPLVAQAQQLAITTTSIPSPVLGRSYSFTFTATGGSANRTWTTASTLPPGLNLSSSGTLSGTATASAVYTVVIRVDDTLFNSATKTFALSVALSSITIATQSPLPAGQVGKTYSQVLASSDGKSPVQWNLALGTLPPGLRLDPATGVLSGTPTARGSFAFTIQAQDANQATDRKAFTLVIDAPSAGPLSIVTPSPLPEGSVGEQYSQTLSAIGGVSPYQWKVLTGDPGPLTLNPATGVLQGTPSVAGTLSFRVQVNDSAGVTASQDYTVTIVKPAPLITITTGATLPAGTVGSAFNQKLAATGGTPPYVWTVTRGEIPGLSLDGIDGTISGTPTTTGSFTITIQAADSNGASGVKTFGIAVSPAALRFTTSTDLPAASFNQPYSQTIGVTGGAPPYVWSANGLPEGLTLDSATGAIRGTPQTAGAANFTVRVVDSARVAVVDLFRLTVALPPVPNVTISGLPATVSPADQMTFRIVLSDTFPTDISGQALLAFAPDSGGGDSSVQFASGGRTIDFMVPAGTSTAVASVPFALQTGTVAGTITVSLRLRAGAADITGSPQPSASARIVRAAPVIRSVAVTRAGSTFTVRIIGYSTAREVTQVNFAFSAATGQTLQTSSLNVPVEDSFAKWFADPASNQFGSQFLFAQNFTIQGDINAVSLTSVTVTNRLGTATSTTITQ